MGILTKYGVRPADGAGSMMRIPGEFNIELTFDVSDLSSESRDAFIAEIQSRGLTTSLDSTGLRVSGTIAFYYSRGNDNQGRRAIWLSYDGTIGDLVAESMHMVYSAKGWNLSSGRIQREIVARAGGEIRLPDGHAIFVGSSEEYNSSLLCDDGSFVHPRLTAEQREILGINDATNDDAEIEDPFK